MPNERCAVCGWPLANSLDGGCVKGNCTMRPLPDRAFEPQRAVEEGYKRYENQSAPSAEECPRCGGELRQSPAGRYCRHKDCDYCDSVKAAPSAPAAEPKDDDPNRLQFLKHWRGSEEEKLLTGTSRELQHELGLDDTNLPACPRCRTIQDGYLVEIIRRAMGKFAAPLRQRIAELEADRDEARAQRGHLIAMCGKVGVKVSVRIGAPITTAYELSNERAEKAEAIRDWLREENARLRRAVKLCLERAYQDSKCLACGNNNPKTITTMWGTQRSVEHTFGCPVQEAEAALRGEEETR